MGSESFPLSKTAGNKTIDDDVNKGIVGFVLIILIDEAFTSNISSKQDVQRRRLPKRENFV